MAYTATTYDPNQKGSAVTLSGSNLIATVTSGTGSVRSTNRITGLTYGEAVVGATMSGSCRIGFCNTSSAFTGLPGADLNSVGWDSGGTVKINNATISTIATFVASDRLGWAIDWQRQLVWFRKNNGDWNNDVIANQNPVGGVGGVSLATMTWGALSFMWGGSATASATARFLASSFTDVAPTGFNDMDTFGATLSNESGGAKLEGPLNPIDAPTLQARSGLVKYAMKAFIPGASQSPAAHTVAITGTTKVNGVLTPNLLVRMYDGVNGQLLDEGYSNGSGVYTFVGQSRADVNVVVVNPPTYRGLIYDKVVPV